MVKLQVKAKPDPFYQIMSQPEEGGTWELVDMASDEEAARSIVSLYRAEYCERTVAVKCEAVDLD